MRDLVIRTARLDERAGLVALQRRASLAVGAHREWLLAHPDVIDLPAEHIPGTQVAECDGAVLGFGVVLSRDDRDAELDGLFVEPTAWRSGIGARLVAEAAKAAALRGASYLWVVSGPEAEGFYVRCGFQRIGVADVQFGTAVTMRRTLSAQGG